MRYTLQKSEILRGYRAFSRVLAEGQPLRSGPVRCFILHDKSGQNALMVGFSVSRSVRRAVDRNRIRRWMKESYRKNKELIAGTPMSFRGTVTVVFLGSVNTANSRSTTIQRAVEHSVVSLLRDLPHHLASKT